MNRLLFALPITLALAALLSGCAPKASSTASDAAPPDTVQVEISTNPEDARCTLSRDGTVFATIERTPGLVALPADDMRVEVSCALPGYKTWSRFVDVGAAIEGDTVPTINFGAPKGKMLQDNAAAGVIIPMTVLGSDAEQDPIITKYVHIGS